MRKVKHPIFTHTYPNGLVLVAEPIGELQSAAFSLLVPAGCIYDPADRAGLSSFTCEMALRGAGDRDSRQFILDLDNLGVERSEIGLQQPYQLQRGNAGRELAPSAGHLCRRLAAAALARRPVGGQPAGDAARASRGRGRALAKGDDRASAAALSRSPGAGRRTAGRRRSPPRRPPTSARFFHRRYQPRGAILGGGRPHGVGAAERARSASCWAIGRPARTTASRNRPAASATPTSPTIRTRRRSASPIPSVPYRDPDYFQAWGAVGVLSGGMSARLFTEVRERRGLCYSVYATLHTLFHRGAVFCYAGTGADRAQETLDVTLAELRRLARGHRRNGARPAQGTDQKRAESCSRSRVPAAAPHLPATNIISARPAPLTRSAV